MRRFEAALGFLRVWPPEFPASVIGALRGSRCGSTARQLGVAREHPKTPPDGEHRLAEFDALWNDGHHGGVVGFQTVVLRV